MPTDTPPDHSPAKLVLTLHTDDARRARVEAWIRELLDSARRTGSLEGSSVLSEPDRNFVLLRFATQPDHDRWRASSEVCDLMARGADFVAPTPAVERTGLETWFALPGTPAVSAAPPKWKMAVVTFCALLPQIVALKFLIPASLPFLVGVAIGTAIPVCMLTWVIMPRLTHALRRWLYPPKHPTRNVLSAPRSNGDAGS